jgi:hypothetical protein
MFTLSDTQLAQLRLVYSFGKTDLRNTRFVLKAGF